MDALFESILWLLGTVIEIYFVLAVINIVLYWAIHFGFIGLGGDAFKKFLKFLHQITEPVHAKLRQEIKPIYGFDLSPYVLILALSFVLHLIDKLCQSMMM